MNKEIWKKPGKIRDPGRNRTFLYYYIGPRPIERLRDFICNLSVSVMTLTQTFYYITLGVFTCQLFTEVPSVKSRQNKFLKKKAKIIHKFLCRFECKTKYILEFKEFFIFLINYGSFKMVGKFNFSAKVDLRFFCQVKNNPQIFV